MSREEERESRARRVLSFSSVCQRGRQSSLTMASRAEKRITQTRRLNARAVTHSLPRKIESVHTCKKMQFLGSGNDNGGPHREICSSRKKMTASRCAVSLLPGA